MNGENEDALRGWKLYSRHRPDSHVWGNDSLLDSPSINKLDINRCLLPSPFFLRSFLLARWVNTWNVSARKSEGNRDVSLVINRPLCLLDSYTCLLRNLIIRFPGTWFFFVNTLRAEKSLKSTEMYGTRRREKLRIHVPAIRHSHRVLLHDRRLLLVASRVTAVRNEWNVAIEEKF